MRVGGEGGGVGEEEREAHRRLKREYMKYRRTAKVGKFQSVPARSEVYARAVCVYRWCILWRKYRAEPVLAILRHLIR